LTSGWQGYWWEAFIAPGLTELTPVEALSLYGRHWRHLDCDALEPKERGLLEALAAAVKPR
jgi:hypothetical protein